MFMLESNVKKIISEKDYEIYKLKNELENIKKSKIYYERDNYRRMYENSAIHIQSLEMKIATLRYELESSSYQKRDISNNTLDDTMLKKLVSLCHPDKHNGSELSNAVTVFLNKERDKFKTNKRKYYD